MLDSYCSSRAGERERKPGREAVGNSEEVENHCGFTTTMGEKPGRGSGKILLPPCLLLDTFLKMDMTWKSLYCQ